MYPILPNQTHRICENSPLLFYNQTRDTSVLKIQLTSKYILLNENEY